MSTLSSSAPIRFSADKIMVGDRPDLILGGEFQYFRLKRDLWESSLKAFKEAGVNLISAYIPWIWHELSEGEFDFDGQTKPERDLRGFLYLCRKLEIRLVVKPGPYIYAEYQGFGVPFWLREKYPETLIQPPQVPDYQEISLPHPTFLEKTRNWFAALAPLIQPMVESGEIVALQLDNETGMPQYGAGPYLIDRNLNSIERLRTYVESRHETIERLNAVWGSSFSSFSQVVPPDRPPQTRGQLVDLAQFIEDGIVDYLQTLKDTWQELGIDTYFFLNDVWLPAWPNHFLKKGRVAPVGFDMYPKFIRVPTPLDQPYAISFVPKMFDSMRRGGPLWGPEVGAGWLDEKVRVPVVSTLEKVMASYLRGAQGIILYPLHEGEDPDHSKYIFRSPFSNQGERSERMEVVEALGQFRMDWGPLLAQSKEAMSPVGILHYQDATHDILEYVCDPIKTARENLDEAIDRGVTVFSAKSGLYGALAEAGYNPQVLELSLATPEELARCRVLFFPNTGHVPEALQEKLAAYVEAGGKLVTLGAQFTESTPRLFPGKAKRTWHPRSLAVVTGTFGDLFMFQLRERQKISHPLVRFTIEKLQPVMGMIKHATRAGVWLSDSLHGGKVWCSRMVTYVQVPTGGEDLINYMKASVGYAVPVGKGTSAFIGTLLGPILDSPGYYLDDPARKQSVISFVSSLLHRWGVKPLLRPVAGLETIVRTTPDGVMLGLINRAEEREFAYPLPEEWQGRKITQQFSYLGSRAVLGDTLSGTMREGDVLCLHLC